MTKGSPGTPSFSYSYLTSGMMGFGRYEKITEEEAIAIENAGDPIDAPPGQNIRKCDHVTISIKCLGPYKIQPEKQGMTVKIFVGLDVRSVSMSR